MRFTMKSFFSLLVFVTLLGGVAFAGSLSTVKVTFKTLSCNGTKGIASIDADSLVKIESKKCEPGSAVPEVYQVLVTGEAGSGLSYRAYTTSEEEALKLMEKIDEYQKAKEDSLRESDRIIIEKRH